MDVPELNTMTVKNLRDLRARIDVAIRAAIAKSRTKTVSRIEGPAKIDLERERDIWAARRKLDSDRPQ